MASEKPLNRPRPPRRNVFLVRPGEFADRCTAKYFPPKQPTTFGYNWPAHPTRPGLLYNPGLDSRDPLAGSVLPRQLQTYIGKRYGPEAVAADRATNQQTLHPNAAPDHAPQLIFRPQEALPANHINKPVSNLRSTSATLGLGNSRFLKAPKNHIRLANTSSHLTSWPARLNHRPQSGNSEFIPASTTAANDNLLIPTSDRRELVVLPAEQRKNLFGTASVTSIRAGIKPHRRGPIIATQRTQTSSEVSHVLFEPSIVAASSTQDSQVASGISSVVIGPKQTAVIQVTDGLGTRNFVLPGSGFRKLTVEPCNQSPLNSSTARKRRAQDSELDLIVANTEGQTQHGHEPFTTGEGAAGLDLDEQGQRAIGRTAWLINIMTSVRGAVTKVSNSIAGYVYPRNYNVIERHSHDQQTGNISTKRVKIEFDANDVEATASRIPGAAQGHCTAKTNIMWVDESTRIVHWHQVALLVQALKNMSRRIQESQPGNRLALHSPQIEDEYRSQSLHPLSAHLRTFQLTVLILEHIYSETFLISLKERFNIPQSIMDYAFNPDEFLAIQSAKALLDDIPNECNSTLIETGATSKIIKGVSADLSAIVDQKPMPGLIQRAGLVGKVIKFFRGRDSFGIDASEDPLSSLDLGRMPGSFPDTQKKSEPLEEETSHPAIGPEPGLLKKKSPKSFIPVVKTETYTYVREHLAEMATKRFDLYKSVPIDMRPEDLRQAAPISILKKDKVPLVALKRLQKSRGMKRVQFSSSTKSSSPSPVRPGSFLSKFFTSRQDTTLGSPLRNLDEEISLSDTQTDGSPGSCRSEKPDQGFCRGSETDITSESSGAEDSMDKHKPRRLQHLRETLDGLEAKNFFGRAGSVAPPASPPSPPTLAGLSISDDKEGELDDLSAALQLMLDEDEAQRREEVARKAKEVEEEKLRLTGGLRTPRRRLITSLPAEWSQKVRDSIRANPNQVLAITAESVELRRHDFLKVVPETEWLNDEIVNGSLQWLDRFVNEAAGATEVRSARRVCLAMNSFFYKRLEDNGVNNTERALRRFGVSKANFLSLETILLPICKNNHWTLLVIRPQKRTVSHMDSFNPDGSSIHVRRALDWVKAFLGDDFNASEWRAVRHEAPRQDNGYDCGVFTITNGMCLALGLNAIDAYSNDELPLQRLRIAGMLLNKGFSGEFDLADI